MQQQNESENQPQVSSGGEDRSPSGETAPNQENAPSGRSGPPVEHPAAKGADEVLSALEVDAEQGLKDSDAESRRQRYGPNQLREARRRSPWRILVDQFKSVVLIVLGVAAILAFAIGQIPEAIAIFAVLLVNGAIGFFSEWRAVRSMEALRKIGQPHVRVRRDGQEREIGIAELVPGDIIFQEGGDVVPADARLVEANNLRVDEAALTGESVAVAKRTEPAEKDAPLAERQSMLFRGTTVTEGSAEAVVVATGMDTQLGQIAAMAEEAERQETPLQQGLDELGSRLAWVVLAVAVVVALAGLAVGRPTLLMIETAIALGIAAVPEGLPIVATIALARGMWLMARRQALINRLTAVETLGATRVIFSDKTGTLTQNRMTLSRVVTPQGEHEMDFENAEQSELEQAESDDPLLRRTLEIGVLCSNASLTDVDSDGEPEEEQGDPTEVALLRAGLVTGLERDSLLETKPEAREVAFDPDVMMMATFHGSGNEFELAVKGAAKPVLEACTRIAATPDEEDAELTDQKRQEWLDRGEQLAEAGLRVLAVADKQVDSADAEPYESLRFVALVGLYDPPAENVKDSIRACQQAGIRLVMVTGDQPATARAIGQQVGLAHDGAEAMHGSRLDDPEDLSADQRREVLDAPIFARVSPEQKLNIMRIFQDEGEIVAMTGDGINDAPALKKADIGVAMGRRGTDAARQAADMVLKDDALDSIVAAVEQGRVIFGNIRKSVMFMLCTNVAEILAVAIAAVVALPLPLRPMQILFLNVITDVFPALALGVGKGDPSVMNRPPRSPDESVITRHHWAAIGGWSALVATCVLVALSIATTALGFDTRRAVTVSFLTLAFAKLWFVVNLRSRGSTLWNNDIVRNGWVWGALGLCIVLLLAAVYAPGLSTLLKTEPPGRWGWLCVLGMSLVPLIVGQIALEVWKTLGRRSEASD
jgi:Ca2+-transporting ATPase